MPAGKPKGSYTTRWAKRMGFDHRHLRKYVFIPALKKIGWRKSIHNQVVGYVCEWAEVMGRCHATESGGIPDFNLEELRVLREALGEFSDAYWHLSNASVRTRMQYYECGQNVCSGYETHRVCRLLTGYIKIMKSGQLTIVDNPNRDKENRRPYVEHAWYAGAGYIYPKQLIGCAE